MQSVRNALHTDLGVPSPQPVFTSPPINFPRKRDLSKRFQKQAFSGAEKFPFFALNNTEFPENSDISGSSCLQSMTQLIPCSKKECNKDGPSQDPFSSPSSCADEFLADHIEACVDPGKSAIMEEDTTIFRPLSRMEGLKMDVSDNLTSLDHTEGNILKERSSGNINHTEIESGLKQTKEVLNIGKRSHEKRLGKVVSANDDQIDPDWATDPASSPCTDDKVTYDQEFLQKSSMAKKALSLLRRRLRDQSFAHGVFKSFPYSNYSKLKFLISTSIAEGCNNSVLLLGTRGSGKIAVVELVLTDLIAEYPDMISVIRLNGLLHSDDNCGLKEIARQLCLEYQLLFSKMASSDDNSQFMLDMLRECGLAHKTLIFLLDEFDLFTQGKQRLLYSLLDAMQTLSSQAVAIGVSCRLDADQLLEKRVRSRFSHRKLLFIPLTTEDLKVFLNHVLYLPEESSFSSKYVEEFNSSVKNILSDKKFNEALNSLSNVDGTISNILRFLYQAVS